MDREFDARPPKAPPLELRRGHIQYPIRLKPFGHIVVTRHGHKPTGQIAVTYPFGDRGGADFGNSAINDAREFVKDNERHFGLWISDCGLRTTIRNPGYPLGAATRN